MAYIENDMTWKSITKAVASAIHAQPGYEGAVIYDENTPTVDSLPAFFIENVVTPVEYKTSGRRVFEYHVQVMYSMDPGATDVRNESTKVALMLSEALELFRWSNNQLIRGWEMNWEISGSDLVFTFNLRVHRIANNERNQ